ncbi:hypothetical protein BDV93DRAFT_563451 [Ceratobasidium sp. AG-I]|nr:hypothetical protein BDV93DRAFT_563451 [Ceratobasidium sp. AG-I]
MSIPTESYYSSPVKTSGPPAENRTAIQAERDSRERHLVSNVPGDAFLEAYLSGRSVHLPVGWSPAQLALVQEIENVAPGAETSLYTGSSPLLRLLNLISKHVFDSLGDPNAPALVFRPGNKRHIANPYSLNQHRFPDVLAVWESSGVLEQLALTNDYLSLPDPPKTWSGLVTVGEVKVKANGSYQLGNYLRDLLQLHPGLEGVFGLAVQAKGYRLMYHNSSFIHQSTHLPWTPGPIYLLISRMYDKPFQAISMAPLREKSETPAWAMKIGEEVFVSQCARPEPGPGQRRFTTIAIHVLSSLVLFIKIFWRDARRRYFEGLMYEKAHKDQILAGLMTVEHHGYDLDEDGKRIRTTEPASGPEVKETPVRYRMLIATRDIGRALEEIRSLRQFLCVMYDACAVQRNLYRKCKILHRDISDGNIMVAPDTDEYRERCATGYADVKFVNQVLAKDKNERPNPACLVIDLGNAADPEVAQGDREARAERTGTPKFIARSVACGEPLDFNMHGSERARMPTLEGTALELHQFTYEARYQEDNSAVNSGPWPETQPEVEFTHRLFHDAESTFWVIAWVLARSARNDYQPETSWTAEFELFTNAMKEHYPTDRRPDGRLTLSSSAKKWDKILHHDLASLANMISKMHEYVRPEWAFRLELDPEHVHEALMRLLLAEITRIDESGQDIPLAVGVRSMPTQSSSRTSSRQSQSTVSQPINPRSHSQPGTSLEHFRDSAVVTSHSGRSTVSRKRNNLHLSEGPPRRSPRLEQRELERSLVIGAGDTENKESPLDQLVAEARKIRWKQASCSLQYPEQGHTD